MPARRSPARRRWLVGGAVLAFAGGAALVAALPEADGPAAAATPPAAPVAQAEPPAAPPAAAAAPAAPAAEPRSVDPEEQVMERLRAAVDEQPKVALALADAADADFPSGRLSDERAYLRMRALVHLGDIGKARTVAGEFFEQHPGSPFARSVYRLTGMRPRLIGPPS